MRSIGQGDILKLISRIFPKYKQEIIARIINDLLKSPVSYQNHISEISSGKRKGYDNLSVEEFYKAFFKEQVNCLKNKPGDLKSKLKACQNFVKESLITFEDCEGRVDDDLESYLRRMLESGLLNTKAWKKNNEKKKVDDEYQEKNMSQSKYPTLKEQNFIPLSTFTGRREIFNEMELKLSNYKTVILSGIGGIGKTAISENYAIEHKNQYEIIHEISFGNTIHSFREAISSLIFNNLDDSEFDEKGRYELKSKIIKNDLDETVLIIFNNVDSTIIDLDVLNDLRQNSNIHIIITTRLHSSFSKYTDCTINVKYLSDEEQLKLFEKHLNEEIEESQKPIVKELLKLIEGHTMMIALLGKSIYKTGLDLNDALELLKEGESDALPAITSEKDNDYNEEKISNILKKLYKISALSTNQQKAIFQLLLLPTAGVHKKLLLRFLMKDYIESVNSLVECSWVEISKEKSGGEIIRLHNLVRDLLKKEMSKSFSDYEQFFNNLCKTIKETDAQKFSDDLCKLANSVIETIPFDSDLCDVVMQNLLLLSDYCFEHYQYMFACNICKRALRLCEKSSGKVSDKAMANLHTKAGKVYQRLADYDSSIEQFKRAIEHQPEGTIELGKSYRKLGEVYRKAGKYEEALEYDNKALNLLTDDIDKAEALNAIGVVYLNMGNKSKSDPQKQRLYYEQAKNFYNDALILREEINASNGEIAFSYHNLGSVYYNLGDFSEAIRYHSKGLEIREENQLNQTDIASSYAWLGNDYIGLKKYDEAKKMIDKSLEIRESVLGKNHPDYAWGLFSLFTWYKSTNDILSAQKVIDEIISIRKQTLGENHEYTRQAIKEKEILLSKCLA